MRTGGTVKGPAIFAALAENPEPFAQQMFNDIATCWRHEKLLDVFVCRLFVERNGADLCACKLTLECARKLVYLHHGTSGDKQEQATGCFSLTVLQC